MLFIDRKRVTDSRDTDIDCGSSKKRRDYNKRYYERNKDKLRACRQEYLEKKNEGVHSKGQNDIDRKRVRDRRDTDIEGGSSKKRRDRNKRYYERNKDKPRACRQKYLEKKNEGVQGKGQNDIRPQTTPLTKQHLGYAGINSFNENVIPEHNVGNMQYACGKCCALMFKDEPHKKIDKSTDELCYSLCCSYGAVWVPPVLEPPPLLKTLLSDNSSTSCHFMKNI